MTLWPCKTCRRHVAASAKACPYCGQPDPAEVKQEWIPTQPEAFDEQRKRWTLTFADGDVEMPTEADLSRIGSFEWGGFAVLTDEDFAGLTDGLRFIQCAEDDDSFFALEYQDGSLQQHYRATNDPISLQQVRAAFQKYYNDDSSWKDDFQWERLAL